MDLCFFENIGATQLAREAGIDPDEIEPVFTYESRFSYIAISKRTSPAIVTQWQATLDEMKSDGTFWWLTNKWLPPDAIMVAERQIHRTDPPYVLKLFSEDSHPVRL